MVEFSEVDWTQEIPIKENIIEESTNDLEVNCTKEEIIKLINDALQHYYTKEEIDKLMSDEID